MSITVSTGMCPLCEASFTTSAAFREHLETQHDLYDDDGTEVLLVDEYQAWLDRQHADGAATSGDAAVGDRAADDLAGGDAECDADSIAAGAEAGADLRGSPRPAGKLSRLLRRRRAGSGGASPAAPPVPASDGATASPATGPVPAAAIAPAGSRTPAPPAAPAAETGIRLASPVGPARRCAVHAVGSGDDAGRPVTIAARDRAAAATPAATPANHHAAPAPHPAPVTAIPAPAPSPAMPVPATRDECETAGPTESGRAGRSVTRTRAWGAAMRELLAEVDDDADDDPTAGALAAVEAVNAEVAAVAAVEAAAVEAAVVGLEQETAAAVGGLLDAVDGAAAAAEEHVVEALRRLSA